ncbi:MAG TPA: hypothetical protein PKC48_00090 [Sphingorhabdus sp.]|jgi:hypothetical protein|nr:hypothetical protein [Sphingorhabdus sp.]
MLKIAKPVIALGLLLANPVYVAQAKSVHSEFVEAWQERLKRYEASSVLAGQQLQSDAHLFFNTPAPDEATTIAKLEAVFKSTDEVGYLAGRSQLSSDLIAFMKKKPSAERAELWLQEQIHRLTDEERALKVEVDSVGQMKIGDNGVTTESLFKANGMAVFKQGALRGQIEELALMNDNLGSYYRAKGQQDADRRQKWAAILGSIGQSLQQQSNDNRSRMVNCTTTGNTTNCMEF